MDEFILKNLEPMSNGEMFGESTMPIRFGDGEIRCRLRFAPLEIRSVRSSTLEIRYEKDVDYTVRGKELILHPEGKPLPFIEEEMLYGKNLPAEIADHPKQYNLPCLYSDSTFIILHQLSVDYRYDPAEWTFVKPVHNPCSFARTHALLRRGSLRMLLYGDSISTGADSSKVMGVPPYLPGWYDMVKEKLESDYGADIAFSNISEGGVTATWAYDHMKERMAGKEADLMIIAFGMNDGSMRLNVEEFTENIRRIREHQANPDCEFLLVGTTVPNEASGLLHDHRAFATALFALEDERTAVVDMGALQQFMLRDKIFIDMSGNNVNHPNDFLARMHALSVLETLEGK